MIVGLDGQPFQGGFTGDLGPLRAKRLSEFLGTEVIRVEYAVGGMLKKGSLYALVGRTGSAKTATAIYQAVCIASGLPFIDRVCLPMPVLYLAAENPEDVRARMRLQIDLLASVPQIVAPDNVQAWRQALEQNLLVLDRTFLLAQKEYEMHSIVNEHSIGAVIVDTDSAVSVHGAGDDNNNGERMDHARRLRTLNRLPSQPVVIDLCHPAGTTTSAKFPFPRGGSAFANEIDGILCQERDGDAITLCSHPEKFRGEPVDMKLKTELVASSMVVDQFNNPIKFPVIRPLVGIQEGLEEANNLSREKLVLRALLERPGKLGKDILTEDLRLPSDQKHVVSRILTKLRKEKLVEDTHNVLTRKGKRTAEELLK